MKEKREKLITSDIWTEKFIREKIFMPFGTMMNSYAIINQGKGISRIDFIQDAEEIFDYGK